MASLLFEHLFSPILSRIFKTGSGGAYPVILGCLCGYPMGAKAVCDSLSGGRIQPREADYLITFVNNPSPVYMTGYVCLYILGREDLRFPLLMIILTVPAITAFIIRRLPGNRHAPGPVLLAAQLSRQNSGGSLNRCITDACDVLVKVGGFMMIFSVFSAPDPAAARNPGCCRLHNCRSAGTDHRPGSFKSPGHICRNKNSPCHGFCLFWRSCPYWRKPTALSIRKGLSVKKYIFGKLFPELPPDPAHSGVAIYSPDVSLISQYRRNRNHRRHRRQQQVPRIQVLLQKQAHHTPAHRSQVRKQKKPQAQLHWPQVRFSWLAKASLLLTIIS